MYDEDDDNGCHIFSPEEVDECKTRLEAQKRPTSSGSTGAAGYIARGLKDHEIQEMVNAIRDALGPMIRYQCLREVISTAAIKYLTEKDLRIDAI
jgi:hypothetical protein